MGINKKKIGSRGLFGPLPEPWREHWQGMPEFVQEYLLPWKTIEIRFNDQKAVDRFSKTIGKNLGKEKTRKYAQKIWFPEAEIVTLSDKRYIVSNQIINPCYPIYIISKGRWESRLTSKALEKMQVPYHIVVEPQEYDNYASVIDPKKS
jgi:hypothetical protein